MTDAELTMRFESLGDDCELGLMQRVMGAEPLGLLRFAAIPLDKAISGVRDGWSGLMDSLEPVERGAPDSREWRMFCPHYAMMWHTFCRPSDMTEEQVLIRETTRTKFLIDKLMQDLTEGTKIFTVKRSRTMLTQNDVEPLAAEVKARGNGALLWMTEDASRAGTIDIARGGVFHGYISAFGDPADFGATMKRGEWLSVMRSVVAQVDDRKTPGS